MNTKIIEITTKDHLTLPGLLFEPKTKSKKAAIWLHGNGSSAVFYSLKRIKAIASALNEKRISFLAFNNRGALSYHKLKSKHGDVMAGMAFELIKDCVKDIDGAISFLKKQGYREFYLIGYSTGANKICVYNYYRPINQVSKYILFSGGDDSGWYYKMFGKNKFFKVLKTCRQMTKKGKGEELVSKDILPYPYSYKALLDIMDPEGNYNTFPFWDVLHHLKLSKKPPFREYKKINKPTLVVYGNKDEYLYGKADKIMELMKKECAHPEKFNFHLAKNQDHGFSGSENLLAKIFADWLSK